MERYAHLALLHGVLVMAALIGLPGSIAGLVILVASVPLLPAWGPFQVDVTFNPEFGDAQRNRWRAALWLVPWTMILYWHLYVRPRQAAN